MSLGNPLGVCMGNMTLNSAYFVGGGLCGKVGLNYVHAHHFVPSTTETTMLATAAPVEVLPMMKEHTAGVNSFMIVMHATFYRLLGRCCGKAPTEIAVPIKIIAAEKDMLFPIFVAEAVSRVWAKPVRFIPEQSHLFGDPGGEQTVVKGVLDDLAGIVAEVAAVPEGTPL